MSSNNLSVKIVVDETDTTVKLGVARANVRTLVTEFNALSKATAAGLIDPAGSARLQQVAGEMLRAKAEAAEFSEQLKKMRETSGGLGGTLEEMQGKISKAFAFTGIGVAVEGVMQLGEAIERLGERAIEMKTFSATLGVSVEQFQAMQMASEEAGIGAEVFARASEKLTTMLTEARAGTAKAIQELHGLGITTGDIADKNFGLSETLAVLKERLEDTATAEQTRKALLQDLGSKTALAIQAIREYNGSQEGVAAAMKKVNGLSGEQVQRLAEAKTAWDEFKTTVTNTVSKAVAAVDRLKDSYRDAVLANHPDMNPQLTQSGPGRSTSSTGEHEAAEAEARQKEAIENESLRVEMEKIKEGVAAFQSGTAERLAALRQYAADAKKYYGAGNVDAVRAANSEVLAAEREYRQEQSSQAIAAVRAQVAAIGAETQLGAVQRLQLEQEEWTKALSNDVVIGNQRLDAAHEFVQKYAEIQKEQAAQAAAITRSDADTEIAVARLALDAKKSLLDQELVAHTVTAGQKLAVLRQYTAETFALDLQELENRLKTLEQEPEKYREVYNQILLLKAKLVADMAKLDQQGAIDAKKAAEEEFTARKIANNEILSAEGTLVSDLLGRHKSLSQSLLSIGQQFVQQEIANDLKAATMRLLITDQTEAATKASMQGGLIYHTVIELQKTLATQRAQAAQSAAQLTGDSTRLAAQASTAATSKAITKATSGNTVMADAARAFSGTYAAVAQIPVIGPFIAPVAAATAFSAVAAYEGLASLDVGTNWIPKTGLYQLHEGEAVTPREYNPVAAGGGYGGGSTSNSSSSVQHNYNGTINTSDSSLKRMLASKANQRVLMDTIAGAYRRGAR